MQSTRLLKILKSGYNTHAKIMEKQKYRQGAGGPIWKTFLFATQQFYSLVHTPEQSSIPSPGSLWDMQILRLHHGFIESEAQRVGPGISV